MTTSIPYKCKFCGATGEAESQCSPEVFAMFRMQHWVPILCCDRCGDFTEQKNRQRDAITDAAFATVRLKQTRTWTADSERIAREKIAKLTQSFADLVCRHHRKLTVWEPEFVDLLIDSPADAHKILNRYIRGVR